MKRLLEFLKKLLKYPFEYRETPFDDYAHAGHYTGKVLTQSQILSLRLQAAIISALDCILTDTSRWQLVINYVTMVASGIKGTILKAGQGLGVDPYFRENYAKAKAAGLKRGTYWYYDSRVHPLEQAKIWAGLVKDDPGELPHFADYEENYGGVYEGIGWFKVFLEEFKRLTGFDAKFYGIYTGYHYWLAHGSTDSYFGQYWLWLAWYGAVQNVIIPRPWTQARLLLWQYTASGDGQGAGVSSLEVDLSYFVPGLVEYEKMFGEVPEVPPSGDTMDGLFEVWSDVYAMSLRTGAFVGLNPDNKVESVPRTTRMKADQITPPTSGGLAGDKWAHVIEINGVTKNLWVAIIHNGVTYCNWRVIDERPAPRLKIEFVDRDGKTWVLEGNMVERP